MGSLSDYGKTSFLEHGLGDTQCPATTSVFLALFTSDPGDDNSGTEVTVANGYIRKAVTFGAAASRRVTQNADVSFNEASGNWGTVTHWAVFDAESGGNQLANGALAAPKDITSGKTPSVKLANQEVYIEIQAGAMSTYLVHALLDRMFRNQTYALPTAYVALIETTEVTDTMSGSALDELDMTGYARKAFGTCTTVSADELVNHNIIDFGTLTGTGETITASAICDALTNGNVLFYDNSQDIGVADGDSMAYAQGAFTVTLN